MNLNPVVNATSIVDESQNATDKYLKVEAEYRQNESQEIKEMASSGFSPKVVTLNHYTSSQKSIRHLT